MSVLPIQYNYAVSGFTPEERSDMFIHKVALSSKVPTKDALNLHDTSILTPPIVMISYGECGYLAFAHVGDKVWTHVDIPAPSIQDIVYHREIFFTVNAMGECICVIWTTKEGLGPYKLHLFHAICIYVLIICALLAFLRKLRFS